MLGKTRLRFIHQVNSLVFYIAVRPFRFPIRGQAEGIVAIRMAGLQLQGGALWSVIVLGHDLLAGIILIVDRCILRRPHLPDESHSVGRRRLAR